MRVVIILFIIVIVLFAATNAEACSRTVYSSDYGVILSRTTDWAVFGHPLVQKMGRDQAITIHNGSKVPVKYGYIAFYEEDGKFSAEAHNEAGLSAAGFYDDTVGFSKDMLDENKGDVSTLFLPNYIVSQFATVDEAVQGLKKIKIHAGALDLPTEGKINLPIHYQIADKTGKTVVMEFRKGKVVFYEDQPVITNEPQIPEQRKNLKRYKPWGGGLDMPGDMASKDRFVRASNALIQIKEMKAPVDEAEAYSLGQELLDALKTGVRQYNVYDPKKEKYGTLWTTYYDMTTGKIAFHSQRRVTPVIIDMNKVDFASGQVTLDVESLQGDITGKLK